MSGMFDWSKDEIEEFLVNNMERIASIVKPRKGAYKYINKLYKEHEIYLISNRAFPYYKDAYRVTVDNLRRNKIKYHKLIFTETNDKSDVCKKYNIDIMFDDRASNCFKLLDKDIRCYLVKTKYERRVFDNLEMVSSWKEIYEKVKELSYEGI